MNYTPPSRPYLDVHNHIGRTINRAPTTGQNTAMCLARFAQTGIRSALAMPTATGSPLFNGAAGSPLFNGAADLRRHNETIARALQDHPQQFPLGLALGEVRFGEAGLEELDKALSELGLHGFVDHPPFNESALPFIEVAAAHNGMVNLHCHTELMVKIARMFPTVTFIVHASTWAAENIAGCDNCIFEIVQYPDGRNSEWDFEKLAGQVGADRLVFGADLPYYDYRQLQQKIESAPISEDLKDRIAWKNASALFQRFNPNWRMPDSPPAPPRIYDDAWLWASNPAKNDRLVVDVIRGPASETVL